MTFRLNGDATASHILTMVDFLPCCPLFHIQVGWEQMTELVLSDHRLIVRPHIVMIGLLLASVVIRLQVFRLFENVTVLVCSMLMINC